MELKKRANLDVVRIKKRNLMRLGNQEQDNSLKYLCVYDKKVSMFLSVKKSFLG
jgi:hypothetical protein